MKKSLLTLFLLVPLSAGGVLCAGDEGSMALRGAGITAEQLAFEREERLRSHLKRAGEHLSENSFAEAVEEYQSVLEIFPEHPEALAGLKKVERERERHERVLREQERLEEQRRERERRIEELRREIEEEKELVLERERERIRAREARLDDRRRGRSRVERAERHLRDGLDFFKREEFSRAIQEWEEVLDLTDRSDAANQRARGWIESANRMQMIQEEIASRREREVHREGFPVRVLDTWTYKPAEERWEEIREERPEEVITPARMRLIERAQQNISVDFDRVHIRQVLKELSRKSGINIVLDDGVFPPAEPEPEPDPEPDPARDPVLFRPRVAPGELFEPELPVEEAPMPRPEPGVAVPELVENPYVTMRLRDIPFIEALDVILRTKGLDFDIEDHFIWITSEEELIVAGDLVTRTYRPMGGLRNIVNMLMQIIPFANTPGVAAPEGAAAPGPAREAGAPGGEVIPGSRLAVDRITGTIIITHTEFYHRLADDIIRRLSEGIPQIAVETKFMDVSTDTLRQIGINLQDIEEFTDVIKDDRLGIELRPPITPGAPRDRGIFMRYQKFTPTQFEAVLHAFEQTGDANLLSAPQVTVRNNYRADIRVGEDFPYYPNMSIRDDTVDVTYRDPDTGERVTASLTRSSLDRGDAERTWIGVELAVIPGVGADRRRINLTLLPRVTDLVRYDTYGDATIAEVRMPVFSSRYLTTNVDINDGETIVLGGLVEGGDSESLSTVPVLGDIPVLGGLFKRRTMETAKRELLIFVTARIIEPTGVPFRMD